MMLFGLCDSPVALARPLPLPTCLRPPPPRPQGALEYSLPLKKAESGLDTLYLWGRVQTRNGKDYVVAEGYNRAFLYKGKVNVELKHFFTQDGVNWADLEDISEEDSAVAAGVNTQFTGDGAKVYEVDASGQEVVKADGEEGGEEAPAEGNRTVTELKRLKFLVKTVTADCGVVPQGSFVENADNVIVPNLNFRGLHHPEKLESYVHFLPGPAAGATLAKDPRGTWTVRFDELQGKALLRSMIWLGYTFYFDARTCEYGGLYVGTGVRNNDLIFML